MNRPHQRLNFSGLPLSATAHFENAVILRRFNFNDTKSRLYKPVDRTLCQGTRRAGASGRRAVRLAASRTGSVRPRGSVTVSYCDLILICIAALFPFLRSPNACESSQRILR